MTDGCWRVESSLRASFAFNASPEVPVHASANRTDVNADASTAVRHVNGCVKAGQLAIARLRRRGSHGFGAELVERMLTQELVQNNVIASGSSDGLSPAACLPTGERTGLRRASVGPDVRGLTEPTFRRK